MRGGAEVARKSHALQVEGSIPSPAPRLDPKEGTRPPHDTGIEGDGCSG